MDQESRNAKGSSPLTVHSSQLKWYVVQTKPQEEDLVRRRLEQACFEIFYPRIRTAVRGRSHSTMRVKSLFPSYLFAHLNLDDANIIHMIKYTRGVRKILGAGTPVPLPEVVIETIRERVSTGDILEQQMVLKKGDRVRIRSGWMRDLVGVLEKPVSAQGRVRVLLSIVDKCIRAELSSADIERLE